MHMQERCDVDNSMSEDFLLIAKSNRYVVQCKTSVGWVTVEVPEYRNGVSYRVIRKVEIKQ